MADMVGRTRAAASPACSGSTSPAPAPERPAFARSNRDAVRSASRLPPPTTPSAAPTVSPALEVVLLDQRGLPEATRRGRGQARQRRGLLPASRRRSRRAGHGPGGGLRAGPDRGGACRAAGIEQRDLQLRRTERALVEARPSSRLLAWSMERMRACGRRPRRVDARGSRWPARCAPRPMPSPTTSRPGTPPSPARSQRSSQGSRREPAQRCCCTATRAHSRRHPGQRHRGAARACATPARAVHVFVTEGRPFMDGARLASWELRQAGIEHKVVPDAPWPGCSSASPSTRCSSPPNGSPPTVTSAPWSAAEPSLSWRRAAGARVIVSGVSATVDPATPDGAAIPVGAASRHATWSPISPTCPSAPPTRWCRPPTSSRPRPSAPWSPSGARSTPADAA